MKTHLNLQKELLKSLKSDLKDNTVLNNDIDFNYDFIPPFCGAKNPKDVKLIILGQDPTIRNKETRKNINVTLNLDKPKGALRRYLEFVCSELNIDLDSQVYATNLYKCFFHQPPADNPQILFNHREQWLTFLREELSVFKKEIPIITLGEPLIKQLITAKNKKVSYYWDYIGNTSSELKFKHVIKSDNLLNRSIYPFPHQPSFSRNKFYKKYIQYYINSIKL